MNKRTKVNQNCKYFSSFQKLSHALVKLLKRREIFVILINVMFFYSYIFECTHLKLALAFLMYI